MTAKLGEEVEKKILETIPLGEAVRSFDSSYQLVLLLLEISGQNM